MVHDSQSFLHSQSNTQLISIAAELDVRAHTRRRASLLPSIEESPSEPERPLVEMTARRLSIGSNVPVNKRPERRERRKTMYEEGIKLNELFNASFNDAPETLYAQGFQLKNLPHQPISLSEPPTVSIEYEDMARGDENGFTNPHKKSSQEGNQKYRRRQSIGFPNEASPDQLDDSNFTRQKRQLRSVPKSVPKLVPNPVPRPAPRQVPENNQPVLNRRYTRSRSQASTAMDDTLGSRDTPVTQAQRRGRRQSFGSGSNSKSRGDRHIPAEENRVDDVHERDGVAGSGSGSLPGYMQPTRASTARAATRRMSARFV